MRLALKVPERRIATNSKTHYYSLFKFDFEPAPDHIMLRFVVVPAVIIVLLSGMKIFWRPAKLIARDDFNDTFQLKTGSANQRAGLRVLADFHLRNYKLDSAAGKLNKAFLDYQNFQVIEDSLFRIEKTTQLRILELRFERSQTSANNRERKAAIVLQYIKMFALILVIGTIAVIFRFFAMFRRTSREHAVRQKEKDLIKKQALEELLGDQVKLRLETDDLVREAHHKVRNNLQMVMSLLNTQTRYLSSEAAINAIDESQHRLQTMMILHQKLYGNAGSSQIDMTVYVAEVISYLSERADNITIKSGADPFAESIHLDRSQAVLVGLFIGEAVSNVLEMNGPAVKNIAALVHLCKIGRDHVRLSVAFTISSKDKENYLCNIGGVSMMKALSEQLSGAFRIDRKDGMAVSVEFSGEKEMDHY